MSSLIHRTEKKLVAHVSAPGQQSVQYVGFLGLLSSRARALGITWRGRLDRSLRDVRRHTMLIPPWTHPYGTSHLEAMEYFLSKPGETFDLYYCTPPPSKKISVGDMRETIIKSLTTRGAKALSTHEDWSPEKEQLEYSCGNYLLESPDGDTYAYISADSFGRVGIHLVGKDRALMAGMIEEFKQAEPEKKKKSNPLKALATTPNGLMLRNIGNIDSPLITENYSQKVVASYEHMMDCLGDEKPCGRLIIIDGDPGTGKSHLIRSIITAAEATSIIVPNTIFHQMSSPSMLPVLLDAATQARGKPLILIIEDADRALVDRTVGSMEALSELLNLSDGLMGELLDLRIIVTTNAARVQLDKATTRPGRLCSHISVPALSADQAALVYKRLSGKSADITKDLTLADVYLMAREEGHVGREKTPEALGQYL